MQLTWYINLNLYSTIDLLKPSIPVVYFLFVNINSLAFNEINCFEYSITLFCEKLPYYKKYLPRDLYRSTFNFVNHLNNTLDANLCWTNNKTQYSTKHSNCQISTQKWCLHWNIQNKSINFVILVIKLHVYM